MKLQDLNCEAVLFQGVYEEGESVFVKLNNEVFLFTENPDDGYRSYMVEEGNVPAPKKAKFSFAKQPVALFARYSDNGSFSGLELFASEEATEPLAQFGTNHMDDYYPLAINYVDVAKINQLFFGK